MSNGSVIPGKFLEVRVRELDPIPGLIGLCAGYEDGDWRCKQLAGHLIEWLPEFALHGRELVSVNPANMVALLAKAAKAVYGDVDPEKRGEIGEILLHAALRQVFNSIPAISKIYFKDSDNDQVKGFDAVHVVVADNDDLELWLGEVKFYKSISSAISDVVEELKTHTEKDYLRSEFTAILNKIDDKWPHAKKLRDLIDRNKSLDVIFKSLCIPVYLTYESKTISDFDSATKEFEEEFEKEVRNYHEIFSSKELPKNITIHLFLLPMGDKQELIFEFDERLESCQKLTS